MTSRLVCRWIPRRISQPGGFTQYPQFPVSTWFRACADRRHAFIRTLGPRNNDDQASHEDTATYLCVLERAELVESKEEGMAKACLIQGQTGRGACAAFVLCSCYNALTPGDGRQSGRDDTD
jgi:hypothetical protein